MRGALQSRTGDGIIDKGCERPCVACPNAYVDSLLTSNEEDSERRERLTEERWYRGRAAVMADKLVQSSTLSGS